jgi:hypothetical protein
MKTFYSSLRLVFSGDTVLLVISIMLFLASLANATHWLALRSCRFCGVMTLFLSLAFFLLSGFELQKHPGQKRTLLAVLFFLAATVTCLYSGHIVIGRPN